MQKIFPILLIGCLSMLFAEVFSGASQVWFFSGWGILLTLPLYLAHVLFFLWIALRSKKTSLSQLYLFGVIFALYESWITKVLWAGHIGSSGPGLGTVLGVGIQEFPILVFFWHPIMSFILPVLVFETLTKKILDGHELILKKTTKKTTLIILYLILIGTFIAKGNQFDLLSSNLSLTGTFILILIFYYFSRKNDLPIFNFRRPNFIIVTAYLILIYIAAFFLILPEKTPKTITPYISIIVFYVIPIYIITKSIPSDTKLVSVYDRHYNTKDLTIFAVITIVSVNIANISPYISSAVVVITYFALELIGIAIFVFTIFHTLKQSFVKKTSNQGGIL